MLLAGFYVLLFLCKGTAGQTTQPWTTWPVTYTTTTRATTAAPATEVPLSHLQLTATPDYPVAEGQKVILSCSALTMPDNVVWTWVRLGNLNWTEVQKGSSSELTLTEPQQSGLYQCHAESPLSQTSQSRDHAVYIVSMHATVGENLGIAAFVLSLLALIIDFLILFWLGWKRLADPQPTSTTVAKGLPGSEKSPKGVVPPADADGDVYMNYTSTNQAYTDLDITNMTTDNVYSSLS
ncbi:uncharacterized protein LOC115597322 [Sparus aurata]|uniref:uncharacterized protein LOC115597322 n=1 Tax=Sparus aurata TaxID=8175 RepID=UPI0011C0F1EC|nr:uncharacterized protein LOC115597322 [Sparus aurata]